VADPLRPSVCGPRALTARCGMATAPRIASIAPNRRVFVIEIWDPVSLRRPLGNSIHRATRVASGPSTHGLAAQRCGRNDIIRRPRRLLPAHCRRVHQRLRLNDARRVGITAAMWIPDQTYEKNRSRLLIPRALRRRSLDKTQHDTGQDEGSFQIPQICSARWP